MRRTVALAGNPNVGKSTVFNALTGSRQHTANWSGKTVACAEGRLRGGGLTLTDLPGTYSLRAHSEEERAAREFLVSGQACAVVLVADAGCLERSLILALQVLEVQKNAILCLNLMDEAAKKGIEIDVAALERELGIPVIPCAARQGKGLHELEAAIRRAAAGENETHPTAIRYPAMDEELTEEQRDDIETAAAALRAEEIALTCVRQPECACARDDRADDVILSRRLGVPLMLLLLAGVFYITLFGANVPSEWLSTHLLALGTPFAGALAKLGLPPFFVSMLTDGLWRVLATVVAVMLPPMAIFFPLFTLLEDAGYLPRVAFQLDHAFQCARASGKQSLTMCMGFGCNACGVTGCRIIDSPRERLIAILTSSFAPCNGRFPLLVPVLGVLRGQRGRRRAAADRRHRGKCWLDAARVAHSLGNGFARRGGVVCARAAAVPHAADRARYRAQRARPDAVRSPCESCRRRRLTAGVAQYAVCQCAGWGIPLSCRTSRHF